MQSLQLILVALVQGLTEYLPISSTAHLILLPRLFGWPDQGLAVDVAANTGTLLAVVAYFRKDLLVYLRALVRGPLRAPSRPPAGRRSDDGPSDSGRGAGVNSDPPNGRASASVAPSPGSSGVAVGTASGRAAHIGSGGHAGATGPDAGQLGAGDELDELLAARRMIPLLALASVPVLAAGIAAGDWIAGDARSPGVIAWATIGFGVVLGVADRFGAQGRRLGEVTWLHAVIFGLAQATALVPGASRAGVVISAGRLLGFDRESSARFAFLLAIPAGVLVAGKDGLDLLRGALPLSQLPSLLLVAALSAVVGYVVIGALLGWLRRRSLQVFVGYRLVLGVVLLVLF